jgi:tetratricopeptide (TPR) repeat protein
MPSRTYMGIQKRPDHSLRVPRPDLSEKSNSPNACNTCHTDKSAPWAAEAIAKWFGPVRKQGGHYGEVFNAYRQGQPSDQLLALLDDKSQPAIVRATALAELANDSTTGLHQRVEATHSPEAELRAAAAESLERVPHAQRVPALTPLLTDPVKAVRMAAARGLSSVPAAELDAMVNANLEKAVAEYLAAQELSADMPGAQLNMATMFQNRGDTSAAETHLLEALHIDPDFTPARLNLAQLYSLSSRLRDAENVLRTGAKRTPAVGEIQYALGLLLAEASQLPEAIKVLSIAAKLQPSRPRVHYNLGLAQQHLGNYKAAEHSLLAAQKLAQTDPVITYALAVLYLQTGQIEKSRSAAQTLQALNPSDPNLRPLLARLQ